MASATLGEVLSKLISFPSRFTGIHHVEAHKEGRYCGQVWYPIRCQFEKTDQEDRGQPALKVLLRVQWKVLHEETGGGHLVLQGQREEEGWWCIRAQHGCWCHSAEHNQALEGAGGDLSSKIVRALSSWPINGQGSGHQHSGRPAHVRWQGHNCTCKSYRLAKKSSGLISVPSLIKTLC